jgi:hypothetical protein
VRSVIDFTSFSPSDPWRAALPLAYALISSALIMLLALSPVGWLLSAVTSSLMRLKVPVEYRQRGRNWVPLKGAFAVTKKLAVAGNRATNAQAAREFAGDTLSKTRLKSGLAR